MYQYSSPRLAVTARTGASGFGFKTLRAIAAQRRREHVWAWASLVLLLVCWDANSRLDEKVSMPRRAHVVEMEQEPRVQVEAH